MKHDAFNDPLLTLKESIAIAGPLGTPSKMPGFSYGLPAAECPVGKFLVKVPNSVCSDCYALKGRYVFSNVKDCQYRRLASLRHPLWTRALSSMILIKGHGYFRWHDSGDLQGPWHLELICEVARRAPGIKFWLPTREKRTVRAFQNYPPNLAIRVSGAMINGAPPAGFELTSTVATSNATCPSRFQDGVCGTCRACWDPQIPNISYQRH